MTDFGRFQSVRLAARKLPVGFEEQSVRRPFLNVATRWLAAFPSRGRAGQCPSLERALPTFRSDQPCLLERELDL